MADLRSIASQVAAVALVAVRSFVGTVLVLTTAGILLACASYYFLSEHHWVYSSIGAAVALFEALTIGVMLGGKRAMAMAIAHALGSLRLGQTLVRVVFERMLGIAESEKHGDRGGKMAKGFERVPLAQAEKLLVGGVQSLTGEVGKGGWLRRKIQSALLSMVSKYTLGRFREEDAAHGGIDLLKMKGLLERTIDETLVKKVRGGLRLWTLIVAVGLPLLVASQTIVFIFFLRSHG